MEQLRIDLVPMGVTPNAHASQYDVGRVIRFLLYNGGTAYTLAGTETITVKMTKPDGTEETVSVTNTSSNYVDFVTTDGLLNQVGLYPCEISITSGTDVIGSKNFNLRVELDPYDGHNIRTVTVGPADICTFTTDLPEFLPSVTVNVVATGGYDADTQTAHPINGFTEANITRCGVNLYSDIFSDYRKPANYYIKNIPLKIGTTYTLKATLKGTAVSGAYVGIASSGEQYTEFQYMTPAIKTDGTTSNNTFSPTSAWTSPKLIIYCSNEAQFNSLFENYDISLTEGTADFTPYNGQTYTIAFGQTVYGGVLDLTRGKLHVTWISYDLGSLNWYYVPSGSIVAPYFYANYSGNVKKTYPVYQTVQPILTSIYKTVKRDASVFINNTLCCDETLGGLLQLQIKDSRYTDAQSFKAAMNGIIMVYETSTPFDIDLTPVQIRALVGENNVFGDTNGDTTVKFKDTIQNYIDKKVST